MSTIKWYRKFVQTPVKNSPLISYFTPLKKTKSVGNSLKKSERNRGYTRRSAEIFRKKEEVKKKYRFYQRSPCTPLYKRCQVIKKKLIFNDDDCETSNYLKETKRDPKKEKIYNAPVDIPAIVLTSPQSSPNELRKIPYSGLLKESEYSFENEGEFSANNYKIATPNTTSLFKNLSPLENHKILGKGRFGCVIESIFKGERVAIKVIDMSKRVLKASILGEQNAIGIKHPNLVHIWSIIWPKDLTKNRYCIVMMDCCTGANNLQKILDNDGIITSDKMIRYSMHVCEALRFLHSSGILHLDVKPKNILVCLGDICKLCDFGSSVKYNGKNTQVDFGLFRGTTQYCSPEILQGKPPTPASDVYSLGITMWQFLHRTVPYGPNIREESLIYRVVKDGLRPFTMPNYTNNFVHFYTRLFVSCWCENPSLRFTTSFILERLHGIRLLLTTQISMSYLHQTSA